MCVCMIKVNAAKFHPPPPPKHLSLCRFDYEVVSLSGGVTTSPFSSAAMFCCKMWTEETAQDSSRREGSSGPRSGQVRGQRLGQTQVGHGEVPPWCGSGCVSLILEKEVWQWVSLITQGGVEVGVSHSGGPEQSLYVCQSPLHLILPRGLPRPLHQTGLVISFSTCSCLS